MTRKTVPSMGFFSPRILAKATTCPPHEHLTTTLFVNNLHCASCVTHVNDLLRPIDGIDNVEVNLLSHTICIRHEPGLTSAIAETLVDAAFEVSHVTSSDNHGRVVSTYDVQSSHNVWNSYTPRIFMNSARRKHMANCKACQAEREEAGLFSRTVKAFSNKRRKLTPANNDIEPGPVEVDSKADQNDGSAEKTEIFEALITIGGMTCASCSNSITSQLRELDFVKEVEINLLANNAKVSFTGPESRAELVTETIEGCGFDATLDLLQKKGKDESCEAIFTIEGMTCGSCVATVSHGLQEVEGVTEVNVNLQGARATVKISGPDLKDKVLEAIEDLGFDGQFVQFIHKSKEAKASRTVEFELLGMYCPACPQNVISTLTSTFNQSIQINSELSLKQPRISITYIPSTNLTIRSLKSAIENVDSSITAQVFHPPSMEDRSRAVQNREWRRILSRLLFSLLAAVPSFVIGVLFMSLMPSTNPRRIWFEQAVWIGNVKRMDWAMLITSTFVMIYGADIFHRRAAKEVWALWRPKSKTPYLRRFYRFGSMNLLISAGTSVAYFSSLAILILEAVSPVQTQTPNHSTDQMTGQMKRHSVTYFDTVVFLTLFILCGKFLQAQSQAKTGEAISELGKLRPNTALLVNTTTKEAILQEVSVDLLETGDIVYIRHGESPPTDGVVAQSGTFIFDESSLTGESKPVKKLESDTILTGSVNKSDPVRIRVTSLGGSGMLDQIINIVRTGQGKRAPVERFADMLTSYFTPVITLIAVLTWIVWLILGESGALPDSWLDVDRGGWAFWSVEFAIAVFVVACPCGLGLAAPTALFVGGGLAAKAGILVQGGGEAFQEASQIDAIVFDKTGTLTEGEMKVVDFRTFNLDVNAGASNVSKYLILVLAKALEESSTHPIAKAIAGYTLSEASQYQVKALEIEEIPGCGITGRFEVFKQETGLAQIYDASIGNERLSLRQAEILSKASEKHDPSSMAIQPRQDLSSHLQHLQSQGFSTAIFSIRTSETSSAWRSSAVFAITDPIRSEALSVLSSLRSQNISVYMCTGDNDTTARAIAAQLDIPASNIRASALPQDKASFISDLQQSVINSTSHSVKGPAKANKRQIIAFVGDGTNDAPALTAADVSIALSSGSDIATKSASFILLNSDLNTILTLVRLARRVFLRVKMNFAWALVYNVALIPVAAGCFFAVAQWRLSPAWAALAMAGSSVSVVLSSLALRLPEVRFRKR